MKITTLRPPGLDLVTFFTDATLKSGVMAITAFISILRHSFQPLRKMVLA